MSLIPALMPRRRPDVMEAARHGLTVFNPSSPDQVRRLLSLFQRRDELTPAQIDDLVAEFSRGGGVR